MTNAEAAVDAARQHAGFVRLLHYQVVDAVAVGALEIVLERHEPAPVAVHLLHVAGGQMPLKMRSFLSYAIPRLRTRLKRFSAE